ncbi:MAG: ATP-grasp domain-containing protein [Bacteroidales bacterium]|nr:ATP-grasp domain-containing protein [Bacteroidales bacterium]
MMQKKLMLLGGIRYLLPVIKAAHEQGYYVITADYLPDNIAHKYSDEYVNVSIIDKDAVLKVARKKHIDGIMSFGVDPGVVSAAYVAERMGLPFQCSYESACILQDKSRFRQFLAEHEFNCPKAKSYDNVDGAIKDMEGFSWPVIVKPVDSAGSKGVTKVERREDLRSSIENALAVSFSKRFIIEDFLDVVGYQSSADVFAVDGNLVFPAFSDQLFDTSAPNPYTPAVEIWPSSMPLDFQNELSGELQRLFTLLQIKTGIFNVESRLCSNGKTYLMEVSPRGGGNRIAELQTMATGQDLVAAEVKQAMGMPVENVVIPQYDGVWCNYILHSSKKGILKSIDIEQDFMKKYVKDEGYSAKKGDEIVPFTGANTSLGTLFLRAETRKEMEAIMQNIDKYITIVLE